MALDLVAARPHNNRARLTSRVSQDIMDYDDLLARFIATVGVYDECRIQRSWVNARGLDVTSVLVEPWDADGWSRWRPRKSATPRAALNELYRQVPGPFPPLFEQLILSYKWFEVDAGRLRLLSNLPPGLMALREEIVGDRVLFETLSSAGVVQFGKGPDFDYDPVCFDLGRRQVDQDCPVVKYDHEEILCNRRLIQVAEVAPTFVALVESVIADAERERSHQDST